MGSAGAAEVENCFFDESSDDLMVDDFSNIDTSLLMSLLEDSGEDEVLRVMIQSLEPENSNQDSYLEADSSSSEEYPFSDESCSTSPPHHHPDFQWLEMEMEMDHSCPNYETTGYFTGCLIGNMVEHGGLEEDYSQVRYEMSMEEDGYFGLWQ